MCKRQSVVASGLHNEEAGRQFLRFVNSGEFGRQRSKSHPRSQDPACIEVVGIVTVMLAKRADHFPNDDFCDECLKYRGSFMECGLSSSPFLSLGKPNRNRQRDLPMVTQS